MSFCRVDDQPIRLREPIVVPDAVVVQDPALLHAVDVFQTLSHTIVVVMDGYVGIEAPAFQTVWDRLGEANVFVFGIGSSVNRALIEGLARAGMGEPFVVTRPDRASKTANRLRKMIESPVSGWTAMGRFHRTVHAMARLRAMPSVSATQRYQDVGTALRSTVVANHADVIDLRPVEE